MAETQVYATLIHTTPDKLRDALTVTNGWGIVVAGLKTLLETGRPMPMPEPVA